MLIIKSEPNISEQKQKKSIKPSSCTILASDIRLHCTWYRILLSFEDDYKDPCTVFACGCI